MFWTEVFTTEWNARKLETMESIRKKSLSTLNLSVPCSNQQPIERHSGPLTTSKDS